MDGLAVTLSQHLRQVERDHPGPWGPDQTDPEDIAPLMLQMAYASKLLARELNRAALVGRLGLVGAQNVTGDIQTKLDVYGNHVIVEAFGRSTRLAGIVSEEMEAIEPISTGPQARYILCIDPIDGSKNVDINNTVGTIFGFYQLPPDCPDGSDGELTSQRLEAELMRPETVLAASGYVMFSTSTLLVYTQGRGTWGFTLDRGIGEFLLSHQDIRCPEEGAIYSANVGRRYDWPGGIFRYMDHVSQADPSTGRPYSLRYSGALVSDVHRSLISGGLYFYPADMNNPRGKLRLLYECAPLALVIEQAGGRSSDGGRRTLEIPRESIHQQSPLVIGSREEVALFESFLAGGPLR